MTEMIAKPQFMVIFIAICLASQSVDSLVRVPRNSDSGRFASFVDVGSTVFYQGICLVAETTQIKMQCSSSDRIKILRTVYGYNPGYSSMTNTPSPDSCAFSVTDCSFDREFTIDNECTGRNSCLMTIRKSRVLNESLFYHQTCKDFNYVQVNYQCLPNLPTKDVCGASKARLSHAYLMTPNFPAPINAGASCECTLSTSYEKGQILLRRIDMKLPGGNDNVNCGETYLEINENEVGVERKCGYERETGSIFGSGAKSLKLNFVTSQSETQRLAQGFWLEVMASPPSENHMIEIVCNPGVYTQQLSNFDILNKLKEIHEKIKRLNKTYLDPKFGRVLNNRTQLFLDKNARKFLNMTNSFSRKITTQKDGEEDLPRSTTLGYKQQKSTSAALAAMRDLELEIEKFFSSNDVQLASQIDEVERKNNNNNNKAFKSKTDSRPSKTKYNDHRLIDLLAIAKSRNGAKKVSTTTNTGKTKSSPANDEEEDEPKTTKDREQEEIEELTQNENEATKKEESDKDEESIPSRSRSRQESNNAESDPNKLIEQLEQLNEELDMGEKLLKHKADPAVLNDTKISDSLAVLLGQTPTPSTHNQAAEHLNVVYANAQRQDFKHSFDSQHHQQQSNVTAVFVGLGVSIAFIALVINAAMCYSCYRKGDSMQRYREALADRSSRFQSSMRQSIDSLNLESVRSLVQDVPRRLREYLIKKLTAGGNIDSTNNSSRSNKRSSGQHGNQSGNEPYDDYNATQGGAGVYGASAGGVSLSSKSEASFSNEEPCIYNSGGESEYNASMLSDSASMAEMKAASGSATPPPPPPPPPCPPPPPPAEQQHRSNTHKSKKSSASRCEDVAANDEVECVNEEETSKSHKKSSKSHHHHHHKNSSHSRRL